jgi:lipopolysaccharide assembly protein A
MIKEVQSCWSTDHAKHAESPLLFAASREVHFMRWVNLAVIIIFAIVMAIFAAQNLQSVTIYFLTFKMTAPHAVLIAVIYLLGMVTGGSLGALMRRAFEGSRSLYDERSRTQ